MRFLRIKNCGREITPLVAPQLQLTFKYIFCLSLLDFSICRLERNEQSVRILIFAPYLLLAGDCDFSIRIMRSFVRFKLCQLFLRALKLTSRHHIKHRAFSFMVRQFFQWLQLFLLR